MDVARCIVHYEYMALAKGLRFATMVTVSTGMRKIGCLGHLARYDDGRLEMCMAVEAAREHARRERGCAGTARTTRRRAGFLPRRHFRGEDGNKQCARCQCWFASQGLPLHLSWCTGAALKFALRRTQCEECGRIVSSCEAVWRGRCPRSSSCLSEPSRQRAERGGGWRCSWSSPCVRALP